MPDTVTIFHAGSLSNVVQQDLAPAFTRATGYSVVLTSGHAVALANTIRSGTGRPDVFMSADAEVNTLLMGPSNGERVRWFLGMAGSRMVIAYSPRSRFAADLYAAAAGTRPWYEVLQSRGFVFKRSDPRNDPGGYRTLFVFQLAEDFYGVPGLKDQILHGNENESQFVTGVPAGLTDGTIDAMMMYVSSAHGAGLPFIQLPDAIDLGNTAFAKYYRQAQYTNPQGQHFYGTPAVYSITILSHAHNPLGAEAFVRTVVSSEGQAAFRRHGFVSVPVVVGGDKDAVPPMLQGVIQGVYSL